jgi:hypothetical protein
VRVSRFEDIAAVDCVNAMRRPSLKSRDRGEIAEEADRLMAALPRHPKLTSFRTP